MYKVYVLKSLKTKKRYVGYTSKSPDDRLKEHNQSSNKWSRENKPFILLMSEDYVLKTDAIKRERFLKSGKGRKYLDKIFKNNL